MDVGDPKDIHPVNKKPVGERLAFLALYQLYGVKSFYPYGPVFCSMIIRGKKVMLKFMPESVKGGMNTVDGKAPAHFFVAGKDKLFYPASAEIKGNTIIVSNALVKNPVAIRYAFTNYPVTNLQNKFGLPAYPFRTDSW